MYMLADIGVPMIVVQMPLMVVTLIPVIVLEAFIVRRPLALSYGASFRGVTIANLISTLIGIPLAWVLMVAIEMVVMIPIGLAADHWHWPTVHSPVLDVLGFLMTIPWLGGYDSGSYWVVPLAVALLLVPSFYASVWVERRICLRAWKGAEADVVRRSVFRANLASYLMLFIVACLWLCYELYLGKEWWPWA
jgi:hypothetical protein